jgi:hypothetical protein
MKKNEMGGVVARMGKRRDAYRVLMGRVHGKKPRGRPKHGWEDKSKMGRHGID